MSHRPRELVEILAALERDRTDENAPLRERLCRRALELVADANRSLEVVLRYELLTSLMLPSRSDTDLDELLELAKAVLAELEGQEDWYEEQAWTLLFLSRILSRRSDGDLRSHRCDAVCALRRILRERADTTVLPFALVDLSEWQLSGKGSPRNPGAAVRFLERAAMVARNRGLHDTLAQVDLREVTSRGV